ncbi:MAG: bifunctional metallophosphatase/5'-nucleotidase [Lachnospiraceae bacterium]
MKGKRKRIWTLVLTAVLCQSMSPAVFAENMEYDEKLVIVHTNDVHSHVDVEPYVKGYVDQLRAEGEQVLLLSAGDAFAGTAFAALSDGQDVVTVMNMVGYEAMVLGNHEQMMDAAKLSAAVDNSNFPVMAINKPAAFDAAVPNLADYIIYDFNGTKIGIIGINAVGGLDNKYDDAYLTGDAFVAAVETAKAKAEAEGATLFIGLSHLGVTDPDETIRSTYIADKCPWLSLLVDGHCHTAHENGLLQNNVLIVETGEYGNNIGVTELYFKDGQIVNRVAGLIQIKGNEANCGITPDAELAAYIAARNTANQNYLNEVVGQIPEDMTSDRNVIRKGEAALGNLITDSWRWKTGADFATFNSSGIRADLTKGDFRREQLLNLFLNQNQVITVEVSGQYIYDWFEASVSAYPGLNASFKQVSGLVVQFDSTREAGSRIVSITLADGTPIEKEGTYIHAVDGEPDFFMDTTGKKDPVEGVDYQAGYGTFQEILVEYLNSGQMEDCQVSGRVQEINGL